MVLVVGGCCSGEYDGRGDDGVHGGSILKQLVGIGGPLKTAHSGMGGGDWKQADRQASKQEWWHLDRVRISWGLDNKNNF